LSRLVVVSNRVPLPRGEKPPEGGLATAVLAALEARGGLWFGWNGGTSSEASPEIGRTRLGAVEFATLPLDKRDYDDYYGGYSNRVLWPLFHLQLDRIEYRRNFYEGYRRVNELLAKRLAPLLRPDDLVWIHDYHLIPLGDALRREGFRSPIGFFLHVPFPPFDVVRALPRYREMLEGLLAYDLVGFQTDIDLHDFQNSVRHGLEDARIRPSSIERGPHSAMTRVFPISVDVDDVRVQARKARGSAAGRRLVQSLSGRRLIIGIDRLDYSKGLVERFRAFERLLERYPETRGEVVLLQVAQPSRGDVPEYQSLRRTLDRVAGEINGRFAEYDWVPIRYLHKGFARATVLGFLSIADVGLVTPLRDGMNLVAKEFVAAQEAENPGALVLSELAGAARELDAAVLVNPYDSDDVAEGLRRAIAMPLDERRSSYQAMMDVLRTSDIHRWRNQFVEELRSAPRPGASPGSVSPRVNVY
jgi:trehalose 6-phosphate synthase